MDTLGMGQTRKNKKSTKRSRWGWHLILDARDCDPKALRSKETIRSFIKELVPAIGMVAFGEPQIVMFGTHDQRGHTLVQLIETSDITAHFAEATNDIYLDVFSCKPYDPETAIKVFRKYFKPGGIKKRFLTRRA